MVHSQGDQIGRIFAYWVTTYLYFGWLFANYRNSPDYWATHFRDKSYVLIMTKIGLGYILGDFFTNASGHPVYDTLFQ
jgi:hypothetical protein